MIDAKRSEHDVSKEEEIGAIILREQALVGPGESVKIRFVDGSKWLGSLTISRDETQTADDLSFMVEGIMFSGDVSIPFSVICEPDGPSDWPICHNGRTYNADETEEYGNQVRAQFYADGPGWTSENAPKVKPVFHCATTRAGEKLASSANKVEATWEKGRAQVKVDDKLTWFSAKDLLKSGPETNEWPQKMPLPSREGMLTAPKKAKPTRRRVKEGVHKRNPATGETFAVLEATG